jgi:hypothetical protein|tara:strand:+ start:3472 stop:3888 length:417 start_codon:yes stop_codon:yes gene_type:complete
MPFYDFRCPEGCGYFDDVFVPLELHGTSTCPECDATLETMIGAVVTIGPMPSKPLVLEQAGRRFESTSEYKQYQRENPGWDFLSPNSKQWHDHKDMARGKAEARAKREGYVDLEDKKVKRGKEKAKRAGKLDKKIYVH